MFKVSKDRRVEWPVLISAPQPGGKIKQHEVTVEFERIPQSEVDTFYEPGGTMDHGLLKRVVVGWKPGQFKDESDQDIEFSSEALDMLLEMAFVKGALVTAWLQLHNGKAAQRKN